MTDTTQQEREALLPCPFCGHESPSFERLGTPRQSCIVICGSCGCRHESSDEGERSGQSWNARATPQGAEPAAVMTPTGVKFYSEKEMKALPMGTQLYTRPPEPKLSELQADAKDAARYREVLRTGVPYSKDVCFTDEQIGQFVDQRIAERATLARQEGSAT